MSERDFQDYLSLYQELYRQLRERAASERETITDDLVFEVELIKQVEVSVDHILMLIEQYIAETGSRAANAFRDGVVPERGSAITRILPPVSRLTGGSFYTLKKQTVLEKLTAFLERFLGLG